MAASLPQHREMSAPVRTFAVTALMVATWSQVPRAAQSSADTTAPSIRITSPAAGANVSRNVNITAAASDAAGVRSVTFTVDGTVIGTDTKAPYSVRWNAKDAGDGSHTLRAEARDAAGNVGTSAPVTVIVGSDAAAADATAPTVSITSPAGGAQVAGTVAVTASASDAVGVISVRFFVDGTVIGTATSAPYSASWNTSGVAAGSYTLRAEARDAAGNIGTSATVSVNVAPPPDTTAPAVSITAPAGGAQVTGTVAVTATASDAVGVTSVTFFVDAAAIGSDTSSPYSVNWNTSGVAAGSHTLRAEARDAAGNVGGSATVTVTIAAANRPPLVTLTAPTSGSNFVAPAVITLTANASDPDGTVSRVDFYDGSTQIGSDSTSPFSINWTASAARAYVFGAVAVDNQGATAAAPSVSVTVTSPSRPSTAIFEPSADNASVTHYVLDVFLGGSNPSTATPVATQDLGKPAVVSGEMTADIARTTALLPPATYVATVTAVTPTASARSAASPPFVIASSTALTILTTLTTPTTSGGALDRAGSTASDSQGRIWVTNASTSLVTAFDATTGDVLATIPVGLSPAGIAVPNGVGKVYVADEGSDTVSVISKATMTLAGTIALPPPSGRRPHHISASPDGRFVYVGEFGANVVDVIDTATDQISARFSTGWPGSKTQVVVPDPAGSVVYAVNSALAPATSTLVALNAETGRWLWYLPLPGEPSDFVVAPDGRTGILAQRADDRIDVIDLEQHAVIRQIELASERRMGGLQVTLDGNLVLIASSAMPAQLELVEMATMARLPPVSLAAAATGAALPAQSLSYIPIASNDDLTAGVVAVDAASRTVVRRFRLPGGGSPYEVVFDPR